MLGEKDACGVGSRRHPQRAEPRVCSRVCVTQALHMLSNARTDLNEAIESGSGEFLGELIPR